MSRCGDCKYFYMPPEWRSATGICEYFIKTNTITPQWIISQKFEVMDFAGLDCKAFEDKLDTPEFPAAHSVPTREERDLDTEYRLTVLEEEIKHLDIARILSYFVR